jgi:ornithine carbamoyltransferase
LVQTHLHGRDWVAPELEWTLEELETALEVGLDLKKKYATGEPHNLLEGKTLFMIFYNPSTRTRNSFECGVTQLGGHANFLDLTTTWIKSEAVKDTAAVLARYGHGMAVRYVPSGMDLGKGNEGLRAYAKWSDIPVINMEDDMFHPCQGLADIMTIKEKKRKFEGKKFVMAWTPGHYGAPVAVAQSNVLLMNRFGMDVTLAHPPGYDLDPSIIKKAREYSEEAGTEFNVTNNLKEAYEGADVVYPKSWRSWKLYREGGLTDKLLEAYRDKYKNWTCTQDLIDLSDKHVIYMHCLPAVRGVDVTDEVIDAPYSVVIDEAENRMHAQKGVMALTMGGLP